MPSRPTFRAFFTAAGDDVASAGLAAAYAGKGVRVNAVNPGRTFTERLAEGMQADALRVGGVRLLPGRFMVIEQAMGVPKGRLVAQRWLSHYIEDMKASGFVAQALARHGIQGAAVAPPQARP